MNLAAKANLAITDNLLTTTHSVKWRLDFARPVDVEVVKRCIEIATHAPSRGNREQWHFIIITDPAKRAAMGDLYREGQASFRVKRPRDIVYINQRSNAAYTFPEGSQRDIQRRAMSASSDYLVEHWQDAPVNIICCSERETIHDLTMDTSFYRASLYGSILPSVWSIMLALRVRGLGSCYTTAHLAVEGKVAALLGIPDNIVQAAYLPVAHFKGKDFKVAKRRPLEEVTHWNAW